MPIVKQRPVPVQFNKKFRYFSERLKAKLRKAPAMRGRNPFSSKRRLLAASNVRRSDFALSSVAASSNSCSRLPVFVSQHSAIRILTAHSASGMPSFVGGDSDGQWIKTARSLFCRPFSPDIFSNTPLFIIKTFFVYGASGGHVVHVVFMPTQGVYSHIHNNRHSLGGVARHGKHLFVVAELLKLAVIFVRRGFAHKFAGSDYFRNVRHKVALDRINFHILGNFSPAFMTKKTSCIPFSVLNSMVLPPSSRT